MDDLNNNLFGDLPLPNGSESSKILNRQMIKKIGDVLPPRASENDWFMIYDSKNDGFSLNTLYRKMDDVDNDNPILLIIRDMKNNVFGAILSSKLHKNPHYYGTGAATFLFRFVPIDGTGGKDYELETFMWTGENEFYIMSSVDDLSIGGGNGRFGLWLDHDFAKGMSQPCETFNNPRLPAIIDSDANDADYFEVRDIEVFGFTA